MKSLILVVSEEILVLKLCFRLFFFQLIFLSAKKKIKKSMTQQKGGLKLMH